MKKTYKYRIFPTKKQNTELLETLKVCCELYNFFLEQRKLAWNKERKSIFYIDQQAILPVLRKENKKFKIVHSQVLQDVAKRIDVSFKAFFKGIKCNNNHGYPKFKEINKYTSFTYPQSGFKINKDKIRLYKIGSIKIKIHRPIEGIIKTCTIIQNPTKKWFVSLSCEIFPQKENLIPQRSVGIDMGLQSFAILSTGKKIPNPKFFKQNEKILAKAHRKLSAQKTKNTEERRKIVARIYEKINNKRHDFIHQISKEITDQFNIICVEDLSINNMKKDNFSCINKAIEDAAWGKFIECLVYKAKIKGKKVIKVNPAYTSQNCSNCGNRQKLNLSNRMYHCLCCGLSIDRDINAAKNILNIGMGMHTLT